MVPPEIYSLMKDYVDQNSLVPTLEWDPKASIPLNFNPFDKKYENQKITAHYFLLVAAITESVLIGRAENGRAILVDLHNFLENNLFTIKDHTLLEKIVERYQFFRQLGSEKNRIPEILVSINSFVEKLPEGDLVKFAESSELPSSMVNELGEHIPRMSGRYSEKAWMYLRWMTRPSDLGIFSNFSPSDLLLPITSYLRDIAECLNLCSYPEESFWDDQNHVTLVREKLTSFAKDMYPDDPTIVDYPFYLLGRWIQGKPLCLDVLRDHLIFLTEVYKKTGQPPVIYDIVVRRFSTTEASIGKYLFKLGILFNYESNIFQLSKYTYKPDFILPDYQKEGKTILLEPHGIWTKLRKRRIKIGRRWMSVTAPFRPDPDEVKFISKLSLLTPVVFYDNEYIEIEYILDVEGPVITSVSKDPKKPKINENIQIQANIFDELSGVKNSYIYYKEKNENSWYKVLMSKSDSNIYYGKIPGFEESVEINYYIEAFDMSDNMRKSDIQVFRIEKSAIPSFNLFSIMCGILVIIYCKKSRI
jgi:hypothetical protein